MKTPYVMPLPLQAVAVLDALHIVTGERELLFPGERDDAKAMSNNTILKALKIMVRKGTMTDHDFLCVASTVLHGSVAFENPHIKTQLTSRPSKRSMRGERYTFPVGS